ncbi:M1 family metallopeptidase [Pedobacter montanisoli]|uniref:M1 family metallopeptidase n=1 Tax=Pedobacter montanisoli TaxID=2923277 RepID=A0ABS9ZZ16_9SPHI|nr:M1 family metallopeptidase [Pedobacter montanisoli]MCJ0743547.1 M1 family metallopeptidase [Pedobacter montanisoli]
MKWNKLFYAAVFTVLTLTAQAQLSVGPEFEQAYQKGTRDRSGAPGKNYWQNTANYDLKIDFNPETRLLKGEVEIVYTNNSPDVLNEIWFKLYPNLYKKGTPRKSKISESDLGDGVQITKVLLNGQAQEIERLVIDGTNMHMTIPALQPGKSLKFKISYNYTLNKGSHVRTGQVDEGAHFIAYSFPRIAVYDDIDGWNKFPYTGSEEFYNDFCNFKAAITVPQNYAVWATGDLLNAKEVFTKNVLEKYLLAHQTDDVVDVIDSVTLAQHKVTAPKPYNTFKFEAKNVVDFAFATSNHYLWKSTSLVVDPNTQRRTRVDAVFNAQHKDYYEVIDFAKKTVHAMSYSFPKWPFPYSHETVFDGLDQMEYPMMVNDNPVDNRTDAITLTDHEIFHTMFPFYMGINETKYGWMDEGWATIGEWLISPMIDNSIVDDYGIAATGSSSGSKDDTPIMTLTPDLKGSGSFTNSYPKPGLGYLYIKDYLGDELFTKALHHYIKLWNGKHPMPYDFFYSMNAGSGKNLDWFWKRWFFEGGVLDMAVKSVNKTAEGYAIEIENKGTKPLPIDLTLSYEDGSTEKIHHTIGVWESGNSIYSSNVKSVKKLKKVVMGSSHVPDKNKKDNVYELN